MNAAPILLSSERERTVVRVDMLRRPLPFASGAHFKEWMHFCIFGPELDVLVNFSLSEEPAVRQVHARVSILVRSRGVWDGDVDTFVGDAVHAPPGDIALRFGTNVLQFRDGAYRVSARLRERPVSVDLVLRPHTRPARAPYIPRLNGPPLHWAILPRLTVSGCVTVGTRRHDLDGDLAYHDHNWGWFGWGEDFAWRWGFALPHDARDPWSLAFAFLSDRAGVRALSQGLFLWRGTRVVRAFRDHDLTIRTSPEFLRPRRLVKIPRVMALVAPGTATDVPRRVTVEARAGGDWLRHRFEAEDLVQVVIPSDVGLGAAILNEVTGVSEVDGQVDGEPFTMSSRSVFEFLGAA